MYNTLRNIIIPGVTASQLPRAEVRYFTNVGCARVFMEKEAKKGRLWEIPASEEGRCYRGRYVVRK